MNKLLAIIAAISSLTVFLPVSAHAWCANIPDNQKINVLSIPGTHDSATIGSSIWLECQNLAIQDQLNCGVRFLDMRVGWHNNKVSLLSKTALLQDNQNKLYLSFRSAGWRREI